MKLADYFQQFDRVDDFSRKSNLEYFSQLHKKFSNQIEADLVIHEPESGKNSAVIPASLISEDELPVTHYEVLPEQVSDKLKEFEIVLCKMHAGIGSSVKRGDYLKNITGRTQLGAKGTDLFLKVDGQYESLAQLQFRQAKILNESGVFKKVWVQNLINEETQKEIASLDSRGVNLRENILQLKVPTLLEGELTVERVAPAGHAFLGFSLLSKIFLEEESSDIYIIGNGEDLNSTADNKVLSWVVDNDIPVTMITTTKLEKDKKGGQISLVRGETHEYLTIVEKAQAEKAGQLRYFEELGLRPQDNKALFNTNIVVINAKSLKERIKKLDTSYNDFLTRISPALIKNTKEQNGKKFTQLEGAIGSVMLNLDKFMRESIDAGVVHFLNLNSKNREKFFIPIKKMEDFEELQEKYEYNTDTGRLDIKEN